MTWKFGFPGVSRKNLRGKLQKNNRPTNFNRSGGPTRSRQVFRSTANGRSTIDSWAPRNNRWPDRWWLPPFPVDLSRPVSALFTSSFVVENYNSRGQIRCVFAAFTAPNRRKPSAYRAKCLGTHPDGPPKCTPSALIGSKTSARVHVNLGHGKYAPRQPTFKPFCWRPCLHRARNFSHDPTDLPSPRPLPSVFPGRFLRCPSYFYGVHPFFSVPVRVFYLFRGAPKTNFHRPNFPPWAPEPRQRPPSVITDLLLSVSRHFAVPSLFFTFFALFHYHFTLDNS